LYMPTPEGILWELYDLDEDPNEQRNLIDELPLVANPLKDALFAEMGSVPNTFVRQEYFLPLKPSR